MGQLRNLAPEITGIGPAFDALNARRQLFVMAYVGQGKRKVAQAYRAAGFTATGDHSAAVNGCNLLHRDDVQAAIREYCQKQLVSLAPIATEVLAEMLESGQTDRAVRAKLIQMVFDRTGLAAAQEIKHTFEHIGNDPQGLARARTLVEQLGLNDDQVLKLLGRSTAAKIIDLEAEDIEPDSPGPAPAEADGAAEREALPPSFEDMLKW